MKAIWILIGILTYFVGMLGFAACTGCTAIGGPEFLTGSGEAVEKEQPDAGAVGVMDPTDPVVDSGAPTTSPEAAVEEKPDTGTAEQDAGMPMVMQEVDSGAVEAAAPVCNTTPHQTGVGGIPFTSCSALGDYSKALADQACAKIVYIEPPPAGGSTQCVTDTPCGSTNIECYEMVESGVLSDCNCWSYGGSLAGHMARGLDDAGSCACPSATSPMWN